MKRVNVVALNGSSQYGTRSNPVNLALNGPNVLGNGTFDAGITGWNALANATLTHETGIKRTGAGSLKCAYNGTANPSFYADIISDATTNKQTAVIWLYAPAANVSKTVIFRIIDQTTGTIIGSASTTLTADTWTGIVLNGQLPGTQTGISVRVIHSTSSAGDVLYADDAYLGQAYDAIVLTGFQTSDITTLKTIFSTKINQGGATLGYRIYFNSGVLRLNAGDGVGAPIASSSAILSANTKIFISAVFNKSGNMVGGVNGVDVSSFAMTTLGNISGLTQLTVGADGAGSNSLNGYQYPTQLIIFQNGLPSDNGASIIADAYNRFRSSKPYKTAYPGGTVVASYDWRSQGRDISGNGNDLTLVGGPPIIKI
jgi:hypothetical protein